MIYDNRWKCVTINTHIYIIELHVTFCSMGTLQTSICAMLDTAYPITYIRFIIINYLTSNNFVYRDENTFELYLKQK
jgi:hypothetical protein